MSPASSFTTNTTTSIDSKSRRWCNLGNVATVRWGSVTEKSDNNIKVVPNICRTWLRGSRQAPSTWTAVLFGLLIYTCVARALFPPSPVCSSPLGQYPTSQPGSLGAWEPGAARGGRKSSGFCLFIQHAASFRNITCSSPLALSTPPHPTLHSLTTSVPPHPNHPLQLLHFQSLFLTFPVIVSMTPRITVVRWDLLYFQRLPTCVAFSCCVWRRQSCWLS